MRFAGAELGVLVGVLVGLLVGLLVGWMVLPSTPRSVMLSQVHPRGGRRYDILSREGYNAPRWAREEEEARC